MASARTFIAKLEDREVAVSVKAAGGSLYEITIDGKTRTVDARRVTGGLSLLVDAQNREVSLSRAGDDYDLLVENRRFRFRMLSEERARRAAARGAREESGRRELKASMPGKVLHLLVAVGDKVETKQGLLVIEAMKMENEIKSAGAGEVKEIRVKPGQAVESGEVLIVLE